MNHHIAPSQSVKIEIPRSGMKILRCGRCPAAAERRMVNGMEVDPAGWEDLMLSGHPARHWRLCPACVKSLVQFVVNAGYPR